MKTFFQSGCIILNSHQKCLRNPGSLNPCKTFGIIFIFYFSWWNGSAVTHRIFSFSDDGFWEFHLGLFQICLIILNNFLFHARFCVLVFIDLIFSCIILYSIYNNFNFLSPWESKYACYFCKLSLMAVYILHLLLWGLLWAHIWLNLICMTPERQKWLSFPPVRIFITYAWSQRLLLTWNCLSLWRSEPNVRVSVSFPIFSMKFPS